MKKIPKLNKLLEGPGDPSGADSFQGGPYGFGGHRQISGVDSSTKAVFDQEQDEINQNIDRSSWVTSKDRKRPVGSPENVLSEREASDQFYRDLPGFPKMNTLVRGKQFVPTPDEEHLPDPLTGEPSEYLGPTINNIPIEDFEFNDDELRLEILNPGNGPMTRGSNNFQINSLSRPAIFINPEETPNIDEPVVPLGGMGVVGWPRKYVPDDYEQRLNQYDNIVMGDLDLLNRKEIQMHQKPTMIPEENTYESVVLETGENMEDSILETEKKSPGEKHRVRRSKSTTALMEMIELFVEEALGKTSPSYRENDLGGSRAFEKSREEVLGDLHSDDDEDSLVSEATFCINTDDEIRAKKSKRARPNKPKAWKRSKKLAKTEFGYKPNKRVLNWPTVRAVARAEELYRQAGGDWVPPKKKDVKKNQPPPQGQK